MTEREPEGWAVPQVPPLAIAGAVLAMLLAVLLVAGWVYGKRLRPLRQQPVTTFPAPGVEIFVHDGTMDPTRLPRPLPPDRAVETAKRRVVAEGLPGWGVPR